MNSLKSLFLSSKNFILINTVNKANYYVQQFYIKVFNIL